MNNFYKSLKKSLPGYFKPPPLKTEADSQNRDEKVTSHSGASLLDCPNEILFMICQHLSYNEQIRLRLVCTRFQRLCLHNYPQWDIYGDALVFTYIEQYYVHQPFHKLHLSPTTLESIDEGIVHVLHLLGMSLRRLTLSGFKEPSCMWTTLVQSCTNLTCLDMYNQNYESDYRSFSVVMSTLGPKLEELHTCFLDPLQMNTCADLMIKFLNPNKLTVLALSVRTDNHLKQICGKFVKLTTLKVCLYNLKVSMKPVHLLPSLRNLALRDNPIAVHGIEDIGWLESDRLQQNLKSLRFELFLDCPLEQVALLFRMKALEELFVTRIPYGEMAMIFDNMTKLKSLNISVDSPMFCRYLPQLLNFQHLHTLRMHVAFNRIEKCSLRKQNFQVKHCHALINVRHLTLTTFERCTFPEVKQFMYNMATVVPCVESLIVEFRDCIIADMNFYVKLIKKNAHLKVIKVLPHVDTDKEALIDAIEKYKTQTQRNLEYIIHRQLPANVKRTRKNIMNYEIALALRRQETNKFRRKMIDRYIARLR